MAPSDSSLSLLYSTLHPCVYELYSSAQLCVCVCACACLQMKRDRHLFPLHPSQKFGPMDILYDILFVLCTASSITTTTGGGESNKLARLELIYTITMSRGVNRIKTGSKTYPERKRTLTKGILIHV